MDEEIIKIAQKYAEKVKAEMPVEMIILYGSYARGNPREFSDIDIAVVIDKPPKNYLEASVHLVDLIMDIDIRIEPILIVKKNNKSGFLESILKYGNIIYTTEH